MSNSEPDQQSGARIAVGWYVLAGVSFIPLIGVIFGLLSICIGLLKRSSGGIRLVAIGTAGIAFTVAIYGSLYLAQKSGQFDDITGQLTQRLLDDTVRSIEFYKLQHGAYPESLEEIRPENQFVDDPFSENQSSFAYILNDGGDSYDVFSLGPDHVPSTADDLRPSPELAQGTGYAEK